MNRPLGQNPFPQRNVMSGHAGMPSPFPTNPYAQYFAGPYENLNRGQFSPSFLEAYGGFKPRNLAVDPFKRTAYHKEFRRQYRSNLSYDFQSGLINGGKNLSTYGGTIVGALTGAKVGAVAGVHGAVAGFFAGGAVAFGTSLLANTGLNYLGEDVQEDRYFEAFRRLTSGKRGARMLGVGNRDRYDTTMPKGIQKQFKEVAKEFDIALKDVYEMGSNGFRNGTLSMDTSKKFSKRLKELVKTSIEVARDLGVSLGDAQKYMSQLSARGATNPAQLAQRMTSSIKATREKTDLDTRFLSQMGNLGFQTSLNYKIDPVVGHKMMVDAVEMASLGSKTPVLKGAKNAYLMAGGIESASTRFVNDSMASVLGSSRSTLGSALSLMEQGKEVSASSIFEMSVKKGLSGVSKKEATKQLDNMFSIMAKYMTSKRMKTYAKNNGLEESTPTQIRSHFMLQIGAAKDQIDAITRAESIERKQLENYFEYNKGASVDSFIGEMTNSMGENKKSVALQKFWGTDKNSEVGDRIKLLKMHQGDSDTMRLITSGAKTSGEKLELAAINFFGTKKDAKNKLKGLGLDLSKMNEKQVSVLAANLKDLKQYSVAREDDWLFGKEILYQKATVKMDQRAKGMKYDKEGTPYYTHYMSEAGRNLPGLETKEQRLAVSTYFKKNPELYDSFKELLDGIVKNKESDKKRTVLSEDSKTQLFVVTEGVFEGMKKFKELSTNGR